ncbi:MAG TPA: hypothetical protein VGK61_04080 [Planctomycetota bacterium]
MRTVTFSDGGIVKLLNDKFVCAWVNRRPDLKFMDGLYPKEWRPRGLPNGAAVTNITSVFAAPDGTVIHAIPGYLNVAGFKRHLEFARKLQARLFDPAVKKEDRAGLFAKAHLEASKEAKDDNESEAHRLLAQRLMRVADLKVDYFDGLGDVMR